MKTLSIATILISLAVGDAFAQPLTTGEERGRPARSGRFSLEIGYTNVYESNVDHDLDAIPSRGSVPSLGLQYRNRSEKPTLKIGYSGARHAYTNTERWDRFSHAFSMEFTPEIAEGVHLESSLELSLKGSSEDRDLSDQAQYRQTIEIRPVRSTRLHLYGTLRVKRLEEDRNRDSFKPNAGFVFEQKLSDDRSIELDARFEVNRPRTPRSRYDRWALEVQYETPGVTPQSELELKFKRRWKAYERLVELEDGSDAPRRDHRWAINVTYEQQFLQRFKVVVEYEYETRRSNDIDKFYSAHQLVTGLRVVL